MQLRFNYVMNRIVSFAKKIRSNPREKLLSYHLLFLVNNNFVTIKQRWYFSIEFIIPDIVWYSWVEQTRSWHACDVGGFRAPFLFIVWLIWNRSTLLLTSKLNEFLKKIKQKQQKTAATTALYQSAVRLLSLCSESVFLFQQTLSVNTPVTLSN